MFVTCLFFLRMPPQFITSDVVDPHALDLSVVGITPTEMEKVALAWLRRFRPPAMHDDIMELRQ